MGRERPALTGVLETVAFRYSACDSPLWARNNRRGGRWNEAGEGATQYLTLHPDGAWAELARAEGLQSNAELELIRMPIWALQLNQQNLVDYSTFDKAEGAGFPPYALVDDDYEQCQAEGKRLRDLGYAGVLAPSAALPGVTNVTLFGRRILSTWGCPTRLASSIPGCVVAVGFPPPRVASRVRHFGEEHVGFSNYVEGRAEEMRLERFRSDEPEAQHRRFGSYEEDDEEEEQREA
jgi:RES domain-containing protein